MIVLQLINHWWTTGSFPDEKLKANIASIYKKGNPRSQANYRPISLLDSIYKIYAALIQRRLAKAMDHEIDNNQYGFRANRSTTIPLGCVMRILEKAEATKDPVFITFWTGKKHLTESNKTN